MDENRIVDIETKVAYQEDLIQELNKIVHEQQTKLDKLQQAYELLAKNYARLAAEGDAEHPVDEKPPHY